MRYTPHQSKGSGSRTRSEPLVQRAPRRPPSAAPSPRSGSALASPRFGLSQPARRYAGSPADGLPEPLKANVEAMSGFSMDDVRVHRNSRAPARLGALAFTKGAEIHLGAGQENHLPHEAWHVVQQKQGRVKATLQLKGEGINADQALEREADRMGARVAATGLPSQDVGTLVRKPCHRDGAPVQRMITDGGGKPFASFAAVRDATNKVAGAELSLEEVESLYDLHFADPLLSVAAALERIWGGGEEGNEAGEPQEGEEEEVPESMAAAAEAAIEAGRAKSLARRQAQEAEERKRLAETKASERAAEAAAAAAAAQPASSKPGKAKAAKSAGSAKSASAPAAASSAASAPAGAGASSSSGDVRIDNCKLVFDGHGQRHFNGTKGSSQWKLPAGEVNPGLQGLIRQYQREILTRSKLKGVSTLYITGFYPSPIGRSGGEEVTGYTIQVDVNLGEGKITYHGYPDDRVKKAGLAETKSSI